MFAFTQNIFFCNFLFFKLLFIYLFFCLCWVFVSVRGLSLVMASGGPLFITVHGPLTVVAALVVEHRLQARRLSSCGSQAWLLCGMWDLPRPGLESTSPALASRFSTTVPPGKPSFVIFLFLVLVFSFPLREVPLTFLVRLV